MTSLSFSKERWPPSTSLVKSRLVEKMSRISSSSSLTAELRESKISWNPEALITGCIRFKGQILVPNTGYGRNKKTRHMCHSGFRKFLVHVKEHEALLTYLKSYCAAIAHKVSSKNRKAREQSRWPSESRILVPGDAGIKINRLLLGSSVCNSSTHTGRMIEYKQEVRVPFWENLVTCLRSIHTHFDRIAQGNPFSSCLFTLLHTMVKFHAALLKTILKHSDGEKQFKVQGKYFSNQGLLSLSGTMCRNSTCSWCVQIQWKMTLGLQIQGCQEAEMYWDKAR